MVPFLEPGTINHANESPERCPALKGVSWIYLNEGSRQCEESPGRPAWCLSQFIGTAYTPHFPPRQEAGIAAAPSSLQPGGSTVSPGTHNSLPGFTAAMLSFSGMPSGPASLSHAPSSPAKADLWSNWPAAPSSNLRAVLGVAPSQTQLCAKA